MNGIMIKRMVPVLIILALILALLPVRAALAGIRSWIRKGSVSWVEIRRKGLSEVIGSWKIIEILLPRIERNTRGRADSRSMPSNNAVPPWIRAGGRGTRPSKE